MGVALEWTDISVLFCANQAIKYNANKFVAVEQQAAKAPR
jgi:hypothetical protein